MLLLLGFADAAPALVVAEAADPQPAPGSAATFEQLLARGKEYLKQQDFEAAARTLEAALALSPDSAEALYQMGVALVSSNRYDEGVRYLERSVEQAPTNLALRLILADVYEKGGRMEQAAAELQRVMDMAPTTPQAAEAEIRLTLLMSKQLINQGRHDTSLEMLSNQVKRHPGDTRLLNHLGISLMVANRLDEAETIFRELIDKNPGDAAAHLNLALVYGSLDQMERAVPHLEEILRIAPGTSMAQKAAVRLGMYRGKQAMDASDFDAALREFRGVTAIDPGNVLAYMSIATIQHQAGQVAEAEAIYTKIVEAFPDNIDARLRLGRLYAETDRVERAISEFEFVVKQGGDQPQVRQAREVLVGLMVAAANAHVSEGRIDEGVALYQKIVEYDPENPEGRRRLGMLLQSKLQLEEARAQFEEMVRLEPQSSEAHFLLGKSLDALNLLDEAQLEYSRALALETSEARIKDLAAALRIARARSLLAGNQVEAGRREIEGLLKEDPKNTIALFFLALVQTQQREYAEAVQTYRTLVEIQPAHQRARINLAMLMERMNRDEDAIVEYRAIIQSGTADPPTLEQAKERLAAAEQRLRGMTYTMGYSIGHDANSNLSDTAPTQELRSDINLGYAYHFKTRNNVRYRFSFSPNYAQFHEGHFDFLTLSFSGFATVLLDGRSWGGGYTHQARLSLMNQQRGSESDEVSVNGSWSLDKRELRGRASLSVQESETPSIFDSNVFTMGASVDQLIGDRSALTLDYDFTDNENALDLGSDYAYREHTGEAALERRITNRLSADLRYTLSLRYFKNADSFSGFTMKRENMMHGIRVGATYRYASDLSFFSNYTYTINDSNLPVGLIFSSEDLQEAVGQQSSSLGDYERGYFSMGMSLRF